jgi:MSHA biogenesis protein MshM
MFRLRAAGYHGPDLFSRSVVKYITQASAGLTRRVNVIADKALLAAFSENTHTIRLKHVQAAVKDSEFGREEPAAAGNQAPARAALFMAVGAALGVGGYFLIDRLHAPPAPPVPVVAPATPVTPEPLSATVPAAPAAKPGVASPPPAADPVVKPQDRPAVATAPGTAPAAGTVVSANTDAEAGNLVEQRIAATREWLRQEAPGTYTIQLLGAEDERQLKNRLRALSKSIEINRIFVYRTVAKNRPSVTVLYGSFPDRGVAREALSQLPSQLKVDKPVLRTVGGIREEIRLREPS